ncbi:MAG: BspA family leucine-rich repeat surface protein [Ruminococcus sp.]|nr:BspA family leucine-rich repeat surface protein [Ruminococcus sp.]
MQSMFEHCESLESIDLSGFDTSKVTCMPFMFGYCESLETIDSQCLRRADQSLCLGAGRQGLEGFQIIRDICLRGQDRPLSGLPSD